MLNSTAQHFHQRRQQLLQTMAPNSLLLLPASPVATRNGSVEYSYRPDSYFYYLSGFSEPEACLVLVKDAQHSTQSILFCRERHPEQEQWEGKRAGLEGAVIQYGFDQALPITQLAEHLPQLLNGKQTLYQLFAYAERSETLVSTALQQLRQQARAGASAPTVIEDITQVLDEMRLIKSPFEVEQMQQAMQISAAAHCNAMRAATPGIYEYKLEAELDYTFRQGGAHHSAYSSIVAGGDNACILHYVENNQLIPDGALVLIDAGCEINGYASDITRTFPVNGRFSPEQAAIYDIVLQANQAAIESVAPGQRWNVPHDVTVRVITEGLIALGILQGELEQLIQSHAYRPYYMHRAGHWLGLDVHDVGAYQVEGNWRELTPGMVFTIEPGIYIAPDDQSVAAKWRGIGVRIEDNVLVTDSGYQVLTQGVPKQRADIEALMA